MRPGEKRPDTTAKRCPETGFGGFRLGVRRPPAASFSKECNRRRFLRRVSGKFSGGSPASIRQGLRFSGRVAGESLRRVSGKFSGGSPAKVSGGSPAKVSGGSPANFSGGFPANFSGRSPANFSKSPANVSLRRIALKRKRAGRARTQDRVGRDPTASRKRTYDGQGWVFVACVALELISKSRRQ